MEQKAYIHRRTAIEMVKLGDRVRRATLPGEEKLFRHYLTSYSWCGQAGEDREEDG
jgi:hypothetical protein